MAKPSACGTGGCGIFPWLPVIAVMSGLFISSSVPGTEIPRLFNLQDYVYHASAYVLLGFLCARACAQTVAARNPALGLSLAIALSCLYGVTDEFHQSFVPQRTMSGLDMLTDAAGSILGGMVYRWRS